MDDITEYLASYRHSPHYNMDDVTEYLASYQQHVSKKAKETEIRNLCKCIKYLLGCFDQVFSLLRTPRYGATDEHFTKIEELIEAIDKQ